MEDEERATSKMGEIKLEEGDTNGAHVAKERSASIPTPNDSKNGSPQIAELQHNVKSRSGSADAPGLVKPKLSRKASSKLATREAPLFDHLPDVTSESCKHFQLIPDCLYGSKHLGSTDNDSLDCECREEWRTFYPLAYQIFRTGENVIFGC